MRLATPEETNKLAELAMEWLLASPASLHFAETEGGITIEAVMEFLANQHGMTVYPRYADPDTGEQPYITNIHIRRFGKIMYNPNYGDSRVCECGHTYDRHFDSYEDMYPIGCKYCECNDFVEAK